MESFLLEPIVDCVKCGVNLALMSPNLEVPFFEREGRYTLKQ